MVALIDKQRHADFRACLKRRWLRSVGGCVALKARIGLCDLKLNEKNGGSTPNTLPLYDKTFTSMFSFTNLKLSPSVEAEIGIFSYTSRYP